MESREDNTDSDSAKSAVPESRRETKISGSVDSLLRELADAPPVSMQSLDLQPGDAVGRFIVGEQIGRGGMGVVFRALDPDLERTLAIKMHASFGGSNTTARLRREAKAMAKLSHPNVLTVFEVGTHRGFVYIAMEYGDGGTLGQWLSDADRGWPEILKMFVGAGRGLAAAHAIGLVHRDFKPDNVLLDSNLRPRVTDFGLVQLSEATPEADADAEVATAEESTDDESSRRLTAAGSAVGTPFYMPPEQYGLGEINAAADQFSFCASLYEALYGQPPFPQKTSALRLAAILEERSQEPPPGKAPSRLWPLLRRGLHPDPAQRFPDLGTLLAELEHDPAVRRRRLGAGVAALVVVGTGAWAIGTMQDSQKPCSAVAADMEQSWDSARAAKLSAALESAAVSTGQRDRAMDVLSEFAERWSSVRVEACRATREDAEQSGTLMDLRFACLDTRLAAFDGTVSALDQGDPEVVRASDEVLAGLPSLDDCSDAEILTRSFAPPPAAAKSDVAGVRRDLARVLAEVESGRAKDGLARTEQLIARAAAIDYAPLDIEAAFMRARLREERDEFESSAVDYQDVLLAAIEIGHEEFVTLAATRLALVLGANLSRSDEGARILEIARASNVRHPNLSNELMIATAESLLARARGDGERAQDAAAHALALREQLSGTSIAAIWREANAYAITLDEGGEFEEAGRRFDAVLEGLEEEYGPEDSRLLLPLRGAAVRLLQAGKFAAAIPFVERRMLLAKRSHGPTSLLTLRAVRDLASALAMTGEFTRPLEMIDDALETYHQVAVEEPATELMLLAARAQILSHMDRCDEALSTYDEVDRLYKSNGGASLATYGESLEHRIRCVSKVRGGKAAWAIAQPLLALQRERFGDDSPSLISPTQMAAHAAVNAKEFEAALGLVEELLDLQRRLGREQGGLAAVAHALRGRCLIETGRAGEAPAEYLASLEAARADPPVPLHFVDQLLIAGYRLADYEEHAAAAHQAVMQARKIATEADEDWTAATLVEIDDWLAERPTREPSTKRSAQ